MKILQISDTHNKHHLLVNLPEADVIVHCGDFIDNGTEKEVLDFLNWFIMLPYKHKIFVTGNHDTCLWDAEAIEDLPKNVHFLQDSECKIEGITFFGLAYNHSEQVIPPDADVLVSHEPPFMILDKDNNIHWGNADLKKKILEVKPRYHFFGHIHGAYGTEKHHGIVFSNAALFYESFQMEGNFHRLKYKPKIFVL
mgnify:FL=1